MKHKVMSVFFALVLVSGFAVSVASAQNQNLHGSRISFLTKNCSGLSLVVTESNLAGHAVRYADLLCHSPA